MNKSKLTYEEEEKVIEYLKKNMWIKGLNEIQCPICGGTITGKRISTSYEAKCSTPGCFSYEIRGI